MAQTNFTAADMYPKAAAKVAAPAPKKVKKVEKPVVEEAVVEETVVDSE